MVGLDDDGAARSNHVGPASHEAIEAQGDKCSSVSPAEPRTLRKRLDGGSPGP